MARLKNLEQVRLHPQRSGRDDHLSHKDCQGRHRVERRREVTSETARGASVGGTHRSRGLRQEPIGQENRRAPIADRRGSAGTRSAICVVVAVPLCRVPGYVQVEVSQTSR